MKNIYLLVLILSLFNCSNNDDLSSEENNPQKTDGSYMRAYVNGELFESINENGDELATVTFFDIGVFRRFIISGRNIKTLNGLKRIVLNLYTEETLSVISTGYIWGSGLDEEIGGEFHEVFTSPYQEIDAETYTGYTKITSIDKEKKIISGEFNFVAYDSENDKDYNVTEGVFSELSYE